mmetsp:Transcript_22371/g.66043  ORF Transcript_22371/g.66043 Transcript_22371/m.66043 type:complete len:109 (-) Transcript_22371:923-1249(-)
MPWEVMGSFGCSCRNQKRRSASLSLARALLCEMPPYHRKMSTSASTPEPLQGRRIDHSLISLAWLAVKYEMNSGAGWVRSGSTWREAYLADWTAPSLESAAAISGLLR